MSSSEIDITKLSNEQLDGLRKQTEAEVKNLTASLQSLRIAQARFQESGTALSAIPADGEGRDVLVPLTQSVFVPGKIGSLSEVLVDVGTGFYIGKSLAGAIDTMKTKADMVATEVNSLQKVLNVKQGNLEVIVQHLEMRAQMMQMAAEAGAGGAGAAPAGAAAAGGAGAGR